MKNIASVTYYTNDYKVFMIFWAHTIQNIIMYELNSIEHSIFEAHENDYLYSETKCRCRNRV